MKMDGAMVCVQQFFSAVKYKVFSLRFGGQAGHPFLSTTKFKVLRTFTCSFLCPFSLFPLFVARWVKADGCRGTGRKRAISLSNPNPFRGSWSPAPQRKIKVLRLVGSKQPPSLVQLIKLNGGVDFSAGKQRVITPSWRKRSSFLSLSQLV